MSGCLFACASESTSTSLHHDNLLAERKFRTECDIRPKTWFLAFQHSFNNRVSVKSTQRFLSG